jgi:hypothetical protein
MRVLISIVLFFVVTIAMGQSKSTNYQSYQNGQFLHGQMVSGTNTNNLAINTWTDSIRVSSANYNSTGTQGAGLGFTFNPPPPLSTPIISSIGEIAIYPNPFSNEIRLDFKDMEAADIKINLVNILGQTEDVSQQTFGGSISLNTVQLGIGTYMLQVKTKKGMAIYKVIKAQ